jgi:protein gp37
MGKNTGIEWTDHSWNPWMGCHKVSSGCKNCYMFREQNQYGRDPNVVVRSKTTFHNPLSWKQPAKIFTCSWSDFFIEEADHWRDEAWDIIHQTPHLIYQILTKRPERIGRCLPKGFFPRNVWFGVTGEDQEQLLKRWDVLDSELHYYQPSILFLSLEPLLGPIDLEVPFDYNDLGDEDSPYWTHPCDWVIVGCESGPNARPTDIEWARSIRDQCRAANVPFFLKQMIVDGKITKMPLLDGVRYAEYPKP